MSIHHNETQSVHELRVLTDKVENLNQLTNLLELEKQEYLKEIQKLKYSNNELKEKLKDLEFLTNESQQQTTVLTSVLSNNVIDLDAESHLNQTLQRRLQQKTKTTNALSRENTIILETNKRLETELESMNQKYIRLQLDRNAQIEQYQTKIIELQNMIDTMHSQQRFTPRASSNYSNSLLSPYDDDEEKSLPTSNGHLGGLQREKTLDFSRMLSGGSFGIPLSPRSPRTPMTHQSFPSSSDISLPAAVVYRNRHYKGGSTIRLNYPMHAIQQRDSLSFTTNTEDEHNILTQYEQDEGESSSRSSFSHSSNATAIVAHDDVNVALQEQKHEFEALLYKQQVEYESERKIMNEMNQRLRKQLAEKGRMMEKYRENDGSMEEYNVQKRRMMEEWIKEKDGLIELYTEQQKQIWKKHEEEIGEMKEEIKGYKESEVQLKHTIKQMKVYSKDKEVEEDAPTSATCYSVRDWFKFGL